MNSEIDELSPQERQAFDRLDRKKAPPASLETRTVAALKEANLIRANKFGWLFGESRIGMTVAASLCFFVLGILVGVWSVSAQSTKPSAPAFMLILRTGPEASRAKSRDEAMQRLNEYMVWADELDRKGFLFGGDKHKNDGQLLRQVDGITTVVAEHPAGPDGAGALAGVFLLQVDDYDQAAEIAKSCPHLKYGGTIEIRQIGRF